MQDVAFTMDGLQQYTIAKWAVKMAIVTEFTSRAHRSLFYKQPEREQLRVASDIPNRTTVWVGRYRFPDHLGTWGTDAWTVDRNIQAYVNTVLVGHLVIQTLTLRDALERDQQIVINTAPGPRPWDEMLTQIWPTVQSAHWPARHSFEDNADFSVFRLIRRYSYGQNVL
jgi:hypothetical protein